MSEDTDKTCDPSLEEGEAGDSEGGDSTLQHLAQLETLAAFLSRFERHEIAPDKTLYKEDDPVEHIFYVMFGKVEVRVGDEVIGVMKGPGVFGAEESHFRVSFPKYVHTAVAVTPTSVVWLAKEDLRTVFELDPCCAAAYMRLQAELRKSAVEKIAGLKGRVTGQKKALEKIQDTLLEKSPKKPNKLPPPPGQLSERLERQSQTIELLFKILGARAANLTELSAILNGLVAKYPEWAKQPDFAKFIQKLREIVESDSKIDLGTPPQR